MESLLQQAGKKQTSNIMERFILDGLQRRLSPNPTIELAELILKEAKGSKEIISVGGGSTIDIGKYIAWKLNIPHTAIPTTAGTGSEVTRYAVFVDKGKKISFEDDALIPDNYILDPSRVVSLPPLHTIASGLDALSQAIESTWTQEATPESKSYSEIAIKRILDNLYDSYKHPQSELFRQQMLWAANYSGRAINITRTSICHAISYPLTTMYGVPHGIACAYTLPFFMRFFGDDRAGKVEKLISKLGVRRVEIDRELVATEALKSKRSQNTLKPITREIILKSLS